MLCSKKWPSDSSGTSPKQERMSEIAVVSQNNSLHLRAGIKMSSGPGLRPGRGWGGRTPLPLTPSLLMCAGFLSKQMLASAPIPAAGIKKKSLCRWDTSCLLWGAGGASLPKRRRRRMVGASAWAPALCYSCGHGAASPLLPACSLRCQLVSSDPHPKCQEK